MPTLSSLLWEIEFQYASTVWPDRVRPLKSVMVNETITGTRRPAILKVLVYREERRLGIERVEYGLHQQHVHPAVQQAAGLLGVGRDQLIKGDRAESRIMHVGRKRGRLAGRPEGAGDETNAARLCGHDRVRRGAGVARPCHVQLVSQLLQLVVRQRDRGGVERVGLDDVRPGLEVLAMDGLDDLRLRQAEQVVVPLQILRPILEPLAAKPRLVQLVSLDHRPHRAVENDNALPQQALQLLRSVEFSVHVQHSSVPSLPHSGIQAALGAALCRAAKSAWRNLMAKSRGAN